MKKLVLVSLALLVGAGIWIGYKMAKGEGFGCCGWGGQKVDPWSAYTPPAEEPPAEAAAAEDTAAEEAAAEAAATEETGAEEAPADESPGEGEA